MRDYAEVRADGVITRAVAHDALAVYDVDELGLDRLDRAVLDALIRRFGGGPVGVGTIAVAIGEEAETVEEVAEPFLVRSGLVARTRSGRVATPAAWAHLGLNPRRRLCRHSKPTRHSTISLCRYSTSDPYAWLKAVPVSGCRSTRA